MNITIRQLRAFRAVAIDGGFTPAAEHLHLTQSTVSQLVRALEDQLGVALLERTTRQVCLTEYGQRFLPVSERLLADLNAGVQDLQRLAQGETGRLRLVTTPLFAASWLPGCLAAFVQQHPGITVTVADDADTNSVIQRVLDDRADIGIAPCEPDDQRIDPVALTQDALHLFCPSNQALAGSRSIHWRKLRKEPLVLFSRGNVVRRLIDQAFAAAGIEPLVRFETVFAATAVGLAGAGLGAAILPFNRQQDRPPPGLSVIPMTGPRVVRTVHLIRPSQRPPTAAANFFSSIAIAHMAARP